MNFLSLNFPCDKVKLSSIGTGKIKTPRQTVRRSSDTSWRWRSRGSTWDIRGKQKTFHNANERNEFVRNLPKTTRIYRFRGIISRVETFSPPSLWIIAGSSQSETDTALESVRTFAYFNCKTTLKFGDVALRNRLIENSIDRFSNADVAIINTQFSIPTPYTIILFRDFSSLGSSIAERAATETRDSNDSNFHVWTV